MRNINLNNYQLPAEWCEHEATWLSWLFNEETWPSNILKEAFPQYLAFIKHLALDEKVRINIQPNSFSKIKEILFLADVNLANIELFGHSTNDCWCRDYGPDFLISDIDQSKIVLDWKYNCWGEKYPPFDADNAIPQRIAKVLGLDNIKIDFVLEGGSYDANGSGVLLTTESCLLNRNRNPSLSKTEIEGYLEKYLKQNEIIWLPEGIVGDDTDGHVDDIARFVSSNKIVVGDTHNKDENYSILKRNKVILENNYEGRFDVISLPMPNKLIVDNVLVPASYCNFYIANKKVIVPIFDDPNDQEALSILGQCFPDREIIGLESNKIIYGLGSFHCLSKQEPKIPVRSDSN